MSLDFTPDPRWKTAGHYYGSSNWNEIQREEKGLEKYTWSRSDYRAYLTHSDQLESQRSPDDYITNDSESFDQPQGPAQDPFSLQHTEGRSTVGRQGVKILRLPEQTGQPQTWSYGLSKPLQIDPHVKQTPGAFRAFSVDDLRRSPPVLTLSEWPRLRSGNQEIKAAANYPNFAAISHVWESSEQTAAFAEDARRPLLIAIEDGKSTHEISWLGLVQSAEAAAVLGCEYLWLDLLCIDQVNRSEDIVNDKALQIKNMANIYSNATAVICMFGGVSAAQGVECQTQWIDRAWTLQEAVLNRDTFLLAVWPLADPRNVGDLSEVAFKHVPGRFRTYLSPFRNFLNVTSYMIGKRYVTVKCLNSSLGDGEISSALRIMVGEEGQLTQGVWLNMFIRTSTKLPDIVYSVAGFFDVQLDPYDEDRDLQDLFNEFARKTATLGGYGMGWLSLGLRDRSGSRVPRDESSLIIPAVPHYGIPNAAQVSGKAATENGSPLYSISGRYFSSHYLLANRPCVTLEHYVKFDTDSQPHVMCAIVLRVISSDSLGRDVNGYIKHTATLCGSEGGVYHVVCDVEGTIHPNNMVVLVSTHKYTAGTLYVMVMQWMADGWVLTANGTLEKPHLESMKKQPRRHFIVGKGSQRVIPAWPCDHENPKTSIKLLPLSYGVLLLEDYGVMGGSTLNKVAWFGKKGDKPPKDEWRKFNILVKGLPQFSVKQSLWLVSSTSANLPTKFDAQMSKIIELPVQLRHLFTGDSEEVLKTACSNGGAVNVKSYSVAVRFAEHMIYLKAALNQEQRMNPQHTKIVVAPYLLSAKGLKDNGYWVEDVEAYRDRK